MISIFVQRFVVVATIAMLMAFTVMTSSAYIFILKLFVPMNNASLEQPKVQLFSELEVTWEVIEPDNFTSYVLNDTVNLNDGSLYWQSAAENTTLEHEFDKMVATIVQNVSEKLNATRIALEEQEKKTHQSGWKFFKKTWANSKTFVLTASGLVFLAGLLQFISSAFVVKIGKKNEKAIRSIATNWIFINTFVSLVLVTCLSIYAALESDTEKHLKNPAYLSEWERSHKYLARGPPQWTVSIVANTYNLIVTFDAIGLIVLIVATSCILNKLN